MATILDYLDTYGTRSLFQDPINEVDSLILCQFAYLKFDGLVPAPEEEGMEVGLQDLAEHPDYERLFQNILFAKSNKKFFQKMIKSRRFSKMRMQSYVNIIETETETQFSAITFLLEDGTVYIAYRGTDESIVGWKEDFNMAFLDPIPGQAYSVEYLKKVAAGLGQPFYVGGHSKGGNLAVYASMNCPEQVKKQIIKIYNMDGPGFRPEVLERYDYESIKDKIIKIIPHSSLIGMLFEQSMDYRVVKSRAWGPLQHDPFSWYVKYGRFVDISQVLEGQKLMDDTLNEWVLSLDGEQLKTFVDTLYQVISATQKDNLIEFSADWLKSINAVLTASKEVDEETREKIKEIMKALLRLTQLKVKAEITQKPKKLMEDIRQKIESIETAEVR